MAMILEFEFWVSDLVTFNFLEINLLFLKVFFYLNLIEHLFGFSFMICIYMIFQLIFSCTAVITNIAFMWFPFIMNCIEMSIQATLGCTTVLTN